MILRVSLLMILAASSVGAETGQISDFTLYGQINRGFLYYDDGAETDWYPFVDGSKSVSRLGTTYDREMPRDWSFQARAEIALNWQETNNISQNDKYDSGYDASEEMLRKIEVSFSHPEHGTFWIGHGAMATDGITGYDLSLTNVVAGTAVKDMAGGLLLRRESDGELSDRRILDLFPTLGSSRRLRLRYDRRLTEALRFGVAAGREVLVDNDGRYYADTAVTYDVTRGDYRVKVGAGLRWAGGYPSTQYRQSDTNFVSSGSVLHRPSRWNVTGAIGVRFNGGAYIYGKLGRRFYDWMPYGWTALSVDTYVYDNSNQSGQHSNSMGAAIVQQFKQQDTQLYGAIRTYEAREGNVNYQRSYAFQTGLRWRF